MGNGTFVGLDVHARSVVAGLIDEQSGEVRTTRAPHATDELVGWLGALAAPVRTAYEAGPTGYGLARALRGAGIECLVAAPSMIPRAPGDRVKSDARDAERLARLLRAGELVGVDVPRPADEAARDLVRAREDARADLMRARHRLSKMLLRHGRVYDARAWTLSHDAWLRRQRLDEPAAQAALVDYYDAALQAAMRRDRLDDAITELAQRPDLAPLVGRLSCLRGVSTLTAVGLAEELGDWHRLSGATIGAYLGLTPSESQSGSRHVARSPRPATATPDDCWSRPPGITGAPRRAARRSSAGGTAAGLRCAPAPRQPGCAFTGAGWPWNHAGGCARRSLRWPSPASLPAGAGALP